MSISLLVADDHEVVRTGVASLLADTDIQIVAEASNGTEAVAQAKKHRPNVVLLDVRMTDGDGLHALDEIHLELPETRVVMLSTYDNPTYVARSVALGACDYVLKGSSRQALIDSIEAAAAGQSPSQGGEMLRIAGVMSKKKEPIDQDVPLTSREMQVLRHVALGLSNKEIGKSLGISIETVKEHVQNILRKVDVSDRTQAAVWAVRKGIV